jgi:hypothetical protein
MGRLGRVRRERANFENTDGLPGVFVGGRDIRVPVQLELNETVGSYHGADTLDITHQDSDNYALFPVRQSSGSLVIVGRDQRGNKGESAIYSLLQSKVMNLENSLRMNISEQAVSDGTGNQGKDMEGLAAIVGTSTLAGINPATFPVWQPGGVASGNGRHAIDSGTNFNETGFTTLHDMYINASQGTDQPDGIFLTPTFWNEYNAATTTNTRYEDVLEANSGFDTLFFNGAGMFFDHDVPSGTVYLLNSRHIAFMRDSEADFTWIDDGQRPVNQDVFVKHMIVEGNIVTDNRRMLGSMVAAT